jgi:hypothetical protein
MSGFGFNGANPMLMQGQAPNVPRPAAQVPAGPHIRSGRHRARHGYGPVVIEIVACVQYVPAYTVAGTVNFKICGATV